MRGRVRLLRAWLAALLAVGLPGAGIASRPASAASSSEASYGLRLWQTDDGLPRNSVQAVAQDADGFLWVGTQRGLVRFDGVRFVPVAAQGDFHEALARHPVRALQVTRDGHLLVALDGGGLWQRRAAGAFVRLALAADPEAAFVRTVLETRDGTMWAGTAAGLFRRTAAGWRRIRMHDGGRPSVFAIGTDGADRVWVGLQAGLARVAEDGESLQIVVGSAAHGPVTSVAEDPAGRLWAASRDGLLRVDRAGEVPRVIAVGPRERVRLLHVGADGQVWLGTDTGIRQLRDDERWVTPTGLAGVEAIALALGEDREQNLWVGTNAGLYRVRAGQFRTVATADGLPRGVALAVREDRAGAMWVGTWGGGLVRLGEGAPRTFSTADGLPDARVFALLEDRRGTLWAGTDAGLARLDAGRVRLVPAPGTPAPLRVRLVAEDRVGTLWVGTMQGLFRRDEDRLVPVPLPGVAPGTPVRAVVEDRRRRLWVCAGESVFRADDRERRQVRRLHAVGSTIHAAWLDHRDVLWLGTAAGLVRIDDTGAFAFTPAHGLAIEEVVALAGDDADRLWLSTKRGLVRTSRSGLDAVASGRGAPLVLATYGARDGMLSTEGTSEASPGAWRRGNGELWFATTRGVVVVPPSTGEPARVPPPIVLEEVLVDGRAVAVAGEVRIPPGSRTLEVRYTAPSFAAPEKVRFRHRLDDFAPTWADAGDRRVATYTNVPPGRYTFQVMARNEEGVWSESPAGLRVAVAPRFVQTPLFAGLCLLGLAGAAWGTYAVRMRQMLARLRAVKAERNRMAREIHDTLLQGVAGIGFQLEAARHRLHRDPDGAAQVLDRVSAHVDSCLGDARRSVRNMRSAWLDGQPLAAALAESGRLLATGKVHLEVHEHDWPAALERDLEDQIFRVAQQAIANAISHANASRIDVTLIGAPRALRVAVADDGCGMAEAAGGDDRPRFGFIGMRERARQLAARLHVDSTPGRGTRVELIVPLGLAGRVRRAWHRRHPAIEPAATRMGA
ncbi:GGDEF domain-containing protein [Luteitalea sp. TBR-22]|uniref:sensor histidine kinase n=1 Tax=Luteitalea sp. TBR-22 TaxID=2802971 RepID=UPI001AF8E90F|nr:sensor histidine kinase [Luteitalea sp. TBR-22]BCS34930.1 GGDEF domain-containing protein [Luteitalea sp. TBR-22]